MISAVIFDMDGVLIDSEPFWQRAEVKIFGEVGIDLTPADTDRTIGLRIDDVVAYWFDKHPWTDRSARDVQDAIVAEVVRLVRSEGVPMRGVPEALDFSLKKQLALGLATSSPFSLIDAVLERLGAQTKFDVVCSAANEEFGKPHPAVYLTAARRLDVSPEQCLVVEDSLYGVEAGKAAGMVVVAVPAPYQYDEKGFDQADYKLRSLDGFPQLVDTLTPAASLDRSG